MTKKSADTNRLSVSLFSADMALLLKLKHRAEKSAGKAVPMAEIVRSAILCKAREEGVAK